MAETAELEDRHVESMVVGEHRQLQHVVEHERNSANILAILGHDSQSPRDEKPWWRKMSEVQQWPAEDCSRTNFRILVLVLAVT